MRNRIALIVLCTLATTVVGTAGTPAQAAPRWAPASSATIHPGVRTSASTNGCRANFIFYDARDVYLGQAARCSGDVGTAVSIDGATRPGTIVYNSWSTSGTRSANDFALVRIHRADRGRVNPSVPFWGGPVAGAARSSFGARVYTYGNSQVYTWGDPEPESPAAIDTLSPRIGIDTSTALWPAVPWCLRCERGAGGWTHYIYTVSPGISGATGSAVLDERGRAFGILGSPAHDASDRVTDLSKALAFMKATTDLDAVRLATGTTPFAVPH